MTYTLYPAILGVLGLISAWLVYLKVKNSPEGEGKVKEISDEIHKGAMVFMAREYRPLTIFAIICIALGLYFSYYRDQMTNKGYPKIIEREEFHNNK